MSMPNRQVKESDVFLGLFIHVFLFTLVCLPHLYQCRKSGSPLYKHYKVYKRPQCGQCFHVITVCRLGDTLTEKIPSCILERLFHVWSESCSKMFDISDTGDISAKLQGYNNTFFIMPLVQCKEGTVCISILTFSTNYK